MPKYKSFKYYSILLLFLFVSSNFYHPNEIRALDNTRKLFEEAEQLYDAGDFQTALEKYKELISLDLSFVGGYRGVNRCYTALEDPKGALIYMESLFLEFPEKGEVSYGLGYSLYNLGKYDEALRYFKKSIELNSNIAAAWNNCAVVYHFIVKDYRRARYYYGQAIKKSKITGDDSVLKVARENISNLPDPVEKKPLTEQYTLQDFINKFISHAENKNHEAIEKLIQGQKENSENAMEWLIGKALRAYSNDNLEDEKTLILLADILQEEYSISFRDSDLFDLFIKYKNLPAMEKKITAQGEDMLEAGSEMEAEGRYQDAMIKYEAALNCFENIRDKKKQGLTFIYIGDVHRKLKNYKLALETYNKALSCFDYEKDKEKSAYTLLSSGEISLMLRKYSEAENYFNRALDIYSSLDDEKTVEKIQRNLKLLATRK